jgi:hypothetical protein
MENNKDIDYEPLDRFGKFLMENLRDRAINHCEVLLEGRYTAPSLLKLQSNLASLTEEQRAVVRRCVISAIDHAIHDFLFKLHERADFENDIQVLVDGINIDDLSETGWGGLHYELFGEDGWEARYSKYGEPPDEA